MAWPSVAYTTRDPAADVLHRVVREHLQTGPWLAGGFARFRSGACGAERLVAFSCKGRGFCPSCGGRRMTERAAHLVDRVIRMSRYGSGS